VGVVATYPNGRALFRPFQIDAFPWVDSHLLPLIDELRYLDGDAVRQLRRLRAGCLGGAPHHWGRLRHGELDDRGQVDAHRTSVEPLHLNVHLGLEPSGGGRVASYTTTEHRSGNDGHRATGEDRVRGT